jgi:UDP-glucose 4-epimerase
VGGAGFIGSNLVDGLLKEGHEVVVVDNLSTGKEENINSNAKFVKMDMCESVEKLTQVFEDAQIVFHLAAKARVQPSIVDPITFNNVNVNGTLNVLVAAKNAGVMRVVYSASSSAYGNTNQFPTPETAPTNPMSPYGLQKLIGEQYCHLFSQLYNLDTCSLRYFNIFGERMLLEGAYCLVMGVFAKQKLEGKPLTIVNDGNQRRDFTFVGDAVKANILAATYPNRLKGQVFNVGNGKNYSINQVAEMMGGPIVYGEKRIEPFETLADNSKIKNLLGWQPSDCLEAWIKEYKKKLGVE